MPITVTCTCGATVRAKDEWAGRKARCPTCTKVLVVPDPNKARPKDEEILEVEAVEEEDDVVECDPAEDRRKGIRTAPERGVTTKARARLGRDEEGDEPPRRSRRDSDEDDEDDRPSRRREREEERRPPRRPRRKITDGYNSGTAIAGILGGLAMMIGAVVWFVLGLMADIIFFYPPILFVLGVIAFVKGLMGRE